MLRITKIEWSSIETLALSRNSTHHSDMVFRTSTTVYHIPHAWDLLLLPRVRNPARRATTLRVLLEKRHAGLKGHSGTEKLTLRDAPANVFLAPPHIRPAKNDALTFPKTVKGLVRSITKEKPNPNNLRHPSTL